MGSAFVTTRDGTPLFYKDWGTGQPVIFSHGWPLQADAWDEQLDAVASHGYRAIAHDRRGHGRSGQPWDGNDMSTYARDLADLIEQLDVRQVLLVGHSTGGGEVTRYLARYGLGRVAKIVLVDAVTPLLLQTPTNPQGLPREAFDTLRANVIQDRSQFYQDLSAPFYGANRPGSPVSQGLRDSFWQWSMQCNVRAAYECITAFSETDLTEDLRRIDIPMLIIHGDDDQIVPIAVSAERTVKLVQGATLKVYPGAPHGLPQTHRAQLTTDLLNFFKG